MPYQATRWYGIAGIGGMVLTEYPNPFQSNSFQSHFKSGNSGNRNQQKFS